MSVISMLKDSVILRRLSFLLFALIIFRILASVPIPEVDIDALRALLTENQILGVFNIFSGGGLANFSIVMLGVFPYITVSIIMQLMTSVIPRLHSLYHEEGEMGRKKFGQYSRIFTIPVAFLNAAGILLYFQAQGIFPSISGFEFFINVLIIAAGSILLMWIGELVTEFGIGNGISFIVFAGIVLSAPILVQQAIISFTTEQIPLYAVWIIGLLIVTGITVWMNEAHRPIPVTYSRFGISTTGRRKTETYLPLKVNPVGVLPIIFSLTVLIFFNYIAIFLSSLANERVASISQVVVDWFANNFYYAITIFIVTAFFTYFHVPIVLNTKRISDNLQKQGAFIPGIRPGEETQSLLDKVTVNLTFYAAVFLGLVTAIPILIFGTNTFVYAIGGTGILIAVSVVMDILKKIKARTYNE